MRQSLVERAIGLALLALLVWLVFLILRPFAGALIWAIVLAVALWPLFARLRAAIGGRSGLAALIVSVALLATMVAPIVRLALDVGRQVDELFRLGEELLRAQGPDPPPWLAGLPLLGSWVETFWTRLRVDRQAAVEQLLPYLRDIGPWLLGLGAGLGRVALELLLSVLLTGLFLFYGELCAHYLRKFVGRVAGVRAIHLVDVAGGTVRAVALGVVGTALVQALLALFGYVVAQVPAAGLLALLAFVFSVVHLPVLLSGIPAAAWLFYQQGASATAIALSLWIVAVSVLDNFLRPYLISQGTRLPVLLIILGVVGGVFAFGAMGLFFGAVVIAVAHRLLVDWLDEPEGERVVADRSS
ncbi:MAG: AI-2E family transporter [Geminicoccaceae bacterium]|nr:AI-2E family transporter [Geminicoccaceae bacterium]MCX7630520.1 AI-2E family transporter [Geminicoccaceae bacterium]MDW8123802.1 AI-2E family transporter [Geminicoccaceae bacterium]